MGSYFGSKATSGLCQPIIAMMPPHDTYIETHLGGGAIMQRKPPARHNIGIERNERTLAKFRCDYPVELIHGCAHEFLRQYDYQGRSYCQIWCTGLIDQATFLLSAFFLTSIPSLNWTPSITFAR